MAADDNLLNDDEIQKLLDSAGGGSPAPSPPASSADDGPAPAPTADAAPEPVATEAAAPAPATAVAPTTSAATPSAGVDAEALLNEVEAGLNAALSGDSSSGNVVGGLDGAVPFEMASFDGAGSGASGQKFSLGALDDVELELQIELGRAELLIEEVLALREGAVVPLDKLAGDPVDILVNGRLLARGEVLVLNDNFCVRVAEIVSPDF